MNLLTRVILSVAAIGAYKIADTTHEIVSPLISGPMAAQQLADSNAAYIGTQVTSRVFNGAGVSLLLGMVLLAVVFIAIWYRPIANMFKTTEKAN